MCIRLNNKAFTLLELLLALAIFAIVVTAIYGTYLSQQKAYIVQDQIAGIQQNLRAAMFIMSREIKLAGYSQNPMIDTEELGIERFGDQNGSGEAYTGVRFSYMREPNGIDDDESGEIDDEDDVKIDVWVGLYYRDNNVSAIGRKQGSDPTAMIADRIDSLVLTYKDGAGNNTTDPKSVRSVLIAIVGRADREDFEYNHTTPYDMNGDGDTKDTEDFPAQNDNYRRRMITSLVKCRNLVLY